MLLWLLDKKYSCWDKRILATLEKTGIGAKVNGVVCCYGSKGAKDLRLPSSERGRGCSWRVLWRKRAATVHWKWNLWCLAA
jgi:hypothetical protein